MSDTIVAVATAPGAAAIGIVRLSGPKSAEIACGLFSPADGRGLSEHGARKAVFGTLADGGQVLDRCIAILFPAPASYTGEDCAELQCHGGTALLSRVCAAARARGARAAEPGEFTRRAFLNGKLDLTGAEAVADLIAADTADGALNAAAQLSGALQNRLAGAFALLRDDVAHLAAYIDYTEEGVEPPDCGEVLERLRRLQAELKALAETFSAGRLFGEGVRCAIIGKPNAGKSSLMNALAGFDRSIVTDTAGTTRDTVEETACIGGLKLRLADTAGLRDARELAERLGVDRAKAAAMSSGLILAVYDGSCLPDEGDKATAELASAAGCEVINIVNKGDLPLVRPVEGAVVVSAKTGEGLDALRAEILRRFGAGSLRPDGSVVTNRRQADALFRAAESLGLAAEALERGFTPDVAWVDAETALRALGEVTGDNVSQSVLDSIFSRFCVGK